jgi:hypothetical protein
MSRGVVYEVGQEAQAKRWIHSRAGFERLVMYFCLQRTNPYGSLVYVNRFGVNIYVREKWSIAVGGHYPVCVVELY